MTAPSSRETPPAPPADGERAPARKRVSARDLFTPHDFRPVARGWRKSLEPRGNLQRRAPLNVFGASADGESPPARERKRIDKILPPRDLGPWGPEAELALTREEIYSDERP